MTELQFIKALAELKVRFNTNPKLYQKSDYDLLLKLLLELKGIIESYVNNEVSKLEDNKADKEDLPTNLSLLIDDLGSTPVHTHVQYELALTAVNIIIQNLQQSAVNINSDINNLLESKQDVLIPGDNITIDNNIISAVGAIYDDTEIKQSVASKMNNDGSNYVSGLTLVSPSISCAWTVKDQNGNTKSTSASTSISVENGAKVDFAGTWKYPAAGDGYKVPTSCSGSWGTTLPSVNTYSESISFENLTSSTSYSQTVSAPKSGLEVLNHTKVVKATGNDSNSTSAGVTFYHRKFYGSSSNPNEDITNLSTELSNSKSKNLTFDCSGGKYFYYAYPKSLGNTSWNVGGLAFTGYNRTEKTITNEYGLDVTYYVYRSIDIQTGSSINTIIS